MNNTTRNILYLTLSFLLVFAFTTGKTWAAECSPDDKCVNCTDKSERIKCKFDRMADEGKKMLETMEGVPDLFTPAQLHGIGKAKERMGREKGRLKPDDFKILTKKRSANCQLVEYSGDGDGVCDPKPPANEDCAEVIGDGIGDDDGICWPLKGKKREVCVQICDEEAVLVDESAMDDNSVAELEGVYDTLTGHAEEVAETIPETASLVYALSKVTTEDPCELQTTLERYSYDEYKKARWAAIGSRAAADVAERFCDQAWPSFFGAFSGAAACAAVEGVATGMSLWWQVISFNEAALDELTLDATIACASQAASGSNQTGEMIQSVQTTLDDVRAQNAEIIRLIKLPPGQRVGYPKP